MKVWQFKGWLEIDGTRWSWHPTYTAKWLEDKTTIHRSTHHNGQQVPVLRALLLTGGWPL